MTLLMVTPYPPYRDGIGTYAVQELRRLRAAGTAVEVLSPLPSAAHHHLALGNLRGVLALIKRARHYESTMIQFAPEMMFGACRGPLERVAVWGGLAALARVTKLEIRLHEIEFGPLARNPAERLAAARALRSAAVVSVHTTPEVDRLATALSLPPSSITLVEHGANFVQATGETQAEARAELGLHPHRHVFLSIGFLQEHKGFDLAARAFRAAGLSHAAELHVVGSVRVNHPDLVAYARSLARLCDATPGVTLHERYVSDADFDRWILAADTVVLPYREIWSSSVLERAKLLGRPIVAADVGGLGDQAPEGTLFFDDPESLAQCLKERAATTQQRAAAGDTDDSDGSSPDGSSFTAGGAHDDGWRVDAEQPDRRGLEAQIRTRARAGRLGPTALGDGDAVPTSAGDALDPLLSLDPLHRPQPLSARPGVSEVKRLMRRLLNWELDPIARKVNQLQDATTEAVRRLDAVDGNGGAGLTSGGLRLVEDPFVHGSMADVAPGGRVLMVGGAGSPLAAALEATGHRLTVVDPMSAPGPIGDGFDAVIALSDATTRMAAVGDGWMARLTQAIGPDGRVIIAVGHHPDGVVDDRRSLATLVDGLRVGYIRTARNERGRWRVEADRAPEDDAEDAERIVLVVAGRAD